MLGIAAERVFLLLCDSLAGALSNEVRLDGSEICSMFVHRGLEEPPSEEDDDKIEFPAP